MNMTFEYWATKWLEAEENEVKPSTHNEYKKVVGNLIEEFKGIDIREITPKMVQALFDDLYISGKAKSTINKRRYNIQQIFRYANLQGLELSNPCSFARTPRKAPRHQRRALTSEEISLVMLEKDKSQYGFYAFMLLYTGLRRSELLALKWEDIDFENNIIRVNKVINYIKNRAIVDDVLKNGDEEKIIPMPEILKNELCKRKEGKRGFIFGASSDVPVNPNTHSYKWEKYKRRIGLNATQHMFRHTYCTMLFEAGVDVKTAAYLMGHRDVHTTLDIYTHLEREKATKKAMKKLNQYINCTDQ